MRLTRSSRVVLGPLFELGRANTRLGTRLTPVQESALQDFANRDYWSRVWIVQEMVLAPSDTSFFGGRNCLVFQCDDMVLEYDRLGAIIEIINPNYFHSADVYNIFPEIARGSALSAVRSAIRPIQLLRTQLRKSDNTGISRPRLLNLVQWLRKWRCGEPVDRIFGLSKMVQTSDFALTPAGYQANNEPEVGTSPQRNDSFLEAIRNHESMFIYGESMSNHPGARTTLFGLTQTFGGLVVTNARLHGRLDGLNCHTGRAVQALPTWVPDFTALSTRHSLIETAGLPAPWTADGAAYVNDDVQGTAVSRPPHVVWDNLGCLSVHGLLCDEIAELAAPLTVPPGAATSVERVHDEMRAWAGHPEVWGRIDAWRRTTPYDQMGTAGGFDGAVRRAAFGSREVLTSNGVFTQAAVDFLDQANSDGGSPFNPLEQMVEVCPEGVLSVQLNRRFFRTRRGLIGVGPDDARIGDRLVMLFGGPTPYLLRARHLHWPESWVFVGDCYAHGLMGSTALEEWERQGAVPPRNEPDTDEWQAKAFLLV
ncbi:hypothetical protein GGR51DRAFT_498709 [Nemania sp. FL0031]|nr:hypothetical protein GGR51DRAFT_498709 [Nemania sp. FL0031]